MADYRPPLPLRAAGQALPSWVGLLLRGFYEASRPRYVALSLDDTNRFEGFFVKKAALTLAGAFEPLAALADNSLLNRDRLVALQFFRLPCLEAARAPLPPRAPPGQLAPRVAVAQLAGTNPLAASTAPPPPVSTPFLRALSTGLLQRQG